VAHRDRKPVDRSFAIRHERTHAAATDRDREARTGEATVPELAAVTLASANSGVDRQRDGSLRRDGSGDDNAQA